MSTVWSVDVRLLAEDYEEAIELCAQISELLAEHLPAAVTTSIAQVMPLVQLPEEEEEEA